MKYLLSIVYIFFTTAGITFMKLGGDSLKLSLKDGFALSMGWKTFLGFAFYLISFLLWQKLIVKYDLSTMVPLITGIVQIIILVIGYFILHESISKISCFGVFVIILGIVIIMLGKK